MEIELYYTPHTRAGRVRWTLEELELPYALRLVDLFRDERNPAHPLGSVPAMTVDGQSMFESGAMCMWLADRLPGMIAPCPPLLAHSGRLTGRDAYVRAGQPVKSRQTGGVP